MSMWRMRRVDMSTWNATPANPRSLQRSTRFCFACLARVAFHVQYTFPMPQFIYTMKGLGKVHQPDTKVLEDIWLSFYYGAKIGVLGLNGAGKSSLLRIMAGEDTSFLGEAFPAERISIGVLD